MKHSIKRLWTLLDEAEIVMLVDRFEGALRARPVKIALVDYTSVWFLLDHYADSTSSVDEFPDVCITISSDKPKLCLSVTGIATVITDPRQRDSLWPQLAGNQFFRSDDPNAMLLRVSPIDAALWSGERVPSRSARSLLTDVSLEFSSQSKAVQTAAR